MKRHLLAQAALFVLALAVVSPTVTSPASAADGIVEEWIDYGDEEGDWIEVMVDENGWVLAIVYEDYELIGAWTKNIHDNDNPDPLEGSGTSVDRAQLTDLLKKIGSNYRMTPAFSQTPIGKLLVARGTWLDARHNPAETGLTEDMGGGGGGGFNPSNGSPIDQVRKQANKGNKNGAEGDDGDDLKPGDAGLFDDDMPGPPELINPNPVGRGGKDHAGGGLGGGGLGGGGSGGPAGVR